MKDATREKYRRKLLELRKELTTRGPAKIEPNRTDDARIGGDEDEQPLNEMLQSIASSRNRNAGAVLALVNRALKRMDDAPEDFGLCLECEEDIAPGRLEAMPYAEYCVSCQQKKDGPKGPQSRKHLTDYK